MVGLYNRKLRLGVIARLLKSVCLKNVLNGSCQGKCPGVRTFHPLMQMNWLRWQRARWRQRPWETRAGARP